MIIYRSMTYEQDECCESESQLTSEYHLTCTRLAIHIKFSYLDPPSFYDDNDNNNDPDDDSEDSESDNDGRRKRRATSPISSTGSKGKKAARVITSKSAAYSRQVSGAGIDEFLESEESLQDFFRPIADLETPLPENTRDYYRTHGNPADRRQKKADF